MARITRRTLVAGALAAPCLAACGGSGTPQAPQTGPVTLRFMWWGNDTRLKLTTTVIEMFQVKHPDITIKPEPGDFSGQWDKLATMVAGGNGPDVIQMDEKYINEYASRGALADLTRLGVDTSAFAKGTVELGLYRGTLFGLNAGINAPIMVANPKVFAEAGVPIPDDTTWTWGDYRRIVNQISAKGAGAYWGSANLAAVDSMLKLWLRQQGKEQFSETEGIAFTPAEVASFWQLMLDMQQEGAFPSAQQTIEDGGKTLEQSFLGTGKVALAQLWSNQITAMDKATGQDLRLLRPPSKTGKAAETMLWYKASMYWSGYAKSKNAAAVATFINFLANDLEAGAVMGTERGVPANTAVRTAIEGGMSASDTKVVAYLDAIAPELGPTAPVPPPGGGQSPSIQKRWAEEMLFGRATPQAAAQSFTDEVRSVIRV